MRILYLTHDLSDPATAKRIQMLRAGGAQVVAAGFARLAPPSTIAGVPVIDFGRTYNGQFFQRIRSVARVMRKLHQHRALFMNADAILARNLEMLAIAKRGHAFNPGIPITYEVLDIHRLLLRMDSIGNFLRRFEGWFCRDAVQIITSSPAFIRDYFEQRAHCRLPTLLVENKVFPAPITEPDSSPRNTGPPWRIGWFGIIRCRQSLDILCEVARENPGLVEVVIRGRVAHDQFHDFDGQVYGTYGVSYHGPYRNPEQLAEIYHDVHFSWAIDMYEEGLNSAWLLPNRLYEGGLYGSVPITESGVEASRFTSELGIGVCLDEPKAAKLGQFLQTLTTEAYSERANASATITRDHWVIDDTACAALVTRICSPWSHTDEPEIAPLSAPLLIVIPCLNEALHLPTVLGGLIAESKTLPMRIVVADGGSTDGTIEIIRQWAAQHPIISYLPNPQRIQSAAVNLAVAQCADDAQFFIRLDAHAEFPAGYCRTLLAEAMRTGADSVTVSLDTISNGGFQDAVAAAQNSRLGNGGAAHRNRPHAGRWVEHGHHALMRVAAFRTVGGYDESFTHNEDAELDARLIKAGYRIWLTAKTRHFYYPRHTPAALFRQYRQYGEGRARTLLKHHHLLRLRQMLPLAVLPAALLALLSPISTVAALPFLGWAGLCLVYGLRISKRRKRAILLLSGVAAMLMHLGWSLGFWHGMVKHARKTR